MRRSCTRRESRVRAVGVCLLLSILLLPGLVEGASQELLPPRTAAAEGPLASPALREIREAVDRGDTAALSDFWEVIRRSGAPLVEPLPGRQDSVLMTFLWKDRGEARNVVVFGGPATAADRASLKLMALEDSNVWFRSFRVHRDAAFAYQLLVDDPLTPIRDTEDVQEIFSRAGPDPLNPDYLPDEAGEGAMYSVAGATVPIQERWYAPLEGKGRGTLDTATVESDILGGTRRVTVYTPPAVSDAVGEEGAPVLDLLVVFDGSAFVRLAGAPARLDGLIGRGAIPPTLAVFVDHADPFARDRELQCHRPFERFLVEELLPWVKDRYPVTDRASGTTVAGASYGGLAAYCAGLRSPAYFGRVIAMSGTFWWSPPDTAAPVWAARHVPPVDSAPLFYLGIGRLEDTESLPGVPSQLEAARILRDSLLAGGHPVDYRENEGGHDHVGWREDLARGLVALVGLHRPNTSGLPFAGALAGDRGGFVQRGGDLEAGGRLLVVSRSGHELVLHDLPGGDMPTRVPTGKGPHEVAVDRERRLAYVADYGMYPTPHEEPIESGQLGWVRGTGRTITVVDLAEQTVQATFELGECLRPHGIAVSSAGTRLWVTCESLRAVWELAARDGRCLRSWPTGQAISHIVEASPDDRRIYVGNVGSSTVTIIDRSQDEVVTVPAGEGAEGLWLSPDGEELWVANTVENTISVLDARTGEPLETLSSGGRFPVKLAYHRDRSEVWVTLNQSGSLAVFDAGARTLKALVQLGTTPLGIAIDGDGSRVFVSTPRRNEIVVLDAASRRILRRLPTGIEPDDVVWFSPR